MFFKRKREAESFSKPDHLVKATLENLKYCVSVYDFSEESGEKFIGNLSSIDGDSVHFLNIDTPPHGLAYILRYCYVLKRDDIKLTSPPERPDVFLNDLQAISEILDRLEGVERGGENAILELNLKTAFSKSIESHEINPKKWGLIQGILASDIGED